MKKNVILKLNNKSKNFYEYMGRFFGSRLVQNKINDRIYDDPNKIWYILLDDNKPVGFASFIGNTIKNLYATTDEQLETLLLNIKKETIIDESIVPRIYINIYSKVKLKIYDDNKYKNFVLITSKEG